MGFDGRVRIYPTLRCNLRCSYCVNRYLPEFRAPDTRKELAPADWIGILSRVGGRGVVITGGEPFLYPGLVDVVNSVNRDRYLAIYSNLTAIPPEFMRGLKRRIKIRATWHVGADLGKFTQQVRALAADGRFNGTVSTMNRAGHPAFEAARGPLHDLPWNLAIDTDQRLGFPWLSGKFARAVRCESRNILVGPDGRRYPCVSCLLTERLRRESLVEEPLSGEWVDVACPCWGHCAPCDGLTERRLTFAGGVPLRGENV